MYRMSKGGTAGQAPDVDSMDAIKMLLQKHPVYAVCILCLALYGLSMLCFVAR